MQDPVNQSIRAKLSINVLENVSVRCYLWSISPLDWDSNPTDCGHLNWSERYMERQRPGERDKQREMVRGKVGRGKKQDGRKEKRNALFLFLPPPLHPEKGEREQIPLPEGGDMQQYQSCSGMKSVFVL